MIKRNCTYLKQLNEVYSRGKNIKIVDLKQNLMEVCYCSTYIGVYNDFRVFTRTCLFNRAYNLKLFEEL